MGITYVWLGFVHRILGFALVVNRICGYGNWIWELDTNL
jgi:hypothetical protein